MVNVRGLILTYCCVFLFYCFPWLFFLFVPDPRAYGGAKPGRHWRRLHPHLPCSPRKDRGVHTDRTEATTHELFYLLSFGTMHIIRVNVTCRAICAGVDVNVYHDSRLKRKLWEEERGILRHPPLSLRLRRSGGRKERARVSTLLTSDFFFFSVSVRG